MIKPDNLTFDLPTERQRLCYYLGPCYDHNREYHVPTTFDVPEKFRLNITADSRIKIVDYHQLEELRDNSGYWKKQEGMLLTALKEEGLCSDLFAIVRGDSSPDHMILGFPFFCKVRTQPQQPAVLLKLIKFTRHWEHFYNYYSSFCTPFDKKIDKFFWRGATTGKSEIPGNRFKLIRDYFDSDPRLDIGYTVFCQGHDDLRTYQKNMVDIPEYSEYKYLLSIPGNDKDSGLAWKLASRSVVLMPRPRVSSWLMENMLLPGFHYIQIQDDFADLIPILDWCDKNQHICYQIAENARLFMKQFLDQPNEIAIERQVIREYFKAFKLNRNY